MKKYTETFFKTNKYINRNFSLKKTEIDYIKKQSKDRVLQNAIDNQKNGYGGIDNWKEDYIGEKIILQTVLPKKVEETTVTDKNDLENPYLLDLKIINGKVKLPPGASQYFGQIKGFKSNYINPKKEHLCALVELPFDPSQRPFKELCELLKNRNGLLMFKDNFYYLDENKGNLTELNLNCSKADLSLLKSLFVHKYAMADHEEIDFINKLTGLNLQVSDCYHSNYQVDSGIDRTTDKTREFREGIGIFFVPDWAQEVIVATSFAKENSKVTYQLKNGETHVHYAGKGGEKQIFVDNLLLYYLFADMRKIIQQSDNPEKGYDKYDVKVTPGQKYKLFSSQQTHNVLKHNQVILGDKTGEKSIIKTKTHP